MRSEKLKEICSILRKSSEENDISIGWIPEHIGVERNKEADKAWEDIKRWRLIGRLLLKGV